MANWWLYGRSNRILEIGNASAVSVIEGIVNELHWVNGKASPYVFPQAAEQAQNLKEQRRREERENLAEMSHIMTSDMMTECAAVAERDMGEERPPQILPDRWKGMSTEQLRSIHRERERQCYEKQVQESP